MIIEKMTRLELINELKNLLNLLVHIKNSPAIEKDVIDSILDRFEEKIDPILEKQFDDFWYSYPRQRRGNKPKAKIAFMKIIKTGKCTADKLIKKAAEYSLSEDVQRGFAKGCESWLNDERYEWKYKQSNQNSTVVALQNIVGQL